MFEKHLWKSDILSKDACHWCMSSHYDHLISIGNFNWEPDKTFISDFVGITQFKILIKSPICLKNFKNPSCRDFFFTKRLNYF